MAEVGYVRVSSAEQNEDRQLIAFYKYAPRSACYDCIRYERDYFRDCDYYEMNMIEECKSPA